MNGPIDDGALRGPCFELALVGAIRPRRALALAIGGTVMLAMGLVTPAMAAESASGTSTPIVAAPSPPSTQPVDPTVATVHCAAGGIGGNGGDAGDGGDSGGSVNGGAGGVGGGATAPNCDQNTDGDAAPSVECSGGGGGGNGGKGGESGGGTDGLAFETSVDGGFAFGKQTDTANGFSGNGGDAQGGAGGPGGFGTSPVCSQNTAT